MADRRFEQGYKMGVGVSTVRHTMCFPLAAFLRGAVSPLGKRESGTVVTSGEKEVAALIPASAQCCCLLHPGPGLDSP